MDRSRQTANQPTQAVAILAMLQYLIDEVSGTSPVTAYLLNMARQNLIDETRDEASMVCAAAHQRQNGSSKRRVRHSHKAPK
jgi:hypothetical protein